MQAWLGLLGVVVGAVLASILAFAQDTVRRRHDLQQRSAASAREDHLRFEQRRFDAYVALLTSANAVYSVVSQGPGKPVVTALTGLTVVASAESLTDYHHRLTLVHYNLLQALSPAFLLTTNEATRESIASVVRADKRLVDVAYGQDEDHNDASLRDALTAHRDAVKNCEFSMRASLGVD